jgi:hypothetical protein
VRAQTRSHHHMTLNSELSDPEELAEADPLTLELQVKRSGSALLTL